MHVHEREDETYIAVEGELALPAATSASTPARADVVFLPRGVVHGFAMRSERARLVIACRPP
jgi:mannose-6-phosphate isomerase-like protein (cupin superfamily)